LASSVFAGKDALKLKVALNKSKKPSAVRFDLGLCQQVIIGRRMDRDQDSVDSPDATIPAMANLNVIVTQLEADDLSIERLRRQNRKAFVLPPRLMECLRSRTICGFLGVCCLAI